MKPNLDTKRMDNDDSGVMANYLYGLDDFCKEFINKDSKILELGSNNGVSTSLFAYYAKEVIAVDVNKSSKLEEILEKYKNINFLQGWIHDIVPKLENNYFDVIYIDADHFVTNVINDILVSSPKLKNGGIMSGHDYHEHEKYKKTAYDAVKIIFGDRPIKTYSDSTWAIQINKA
jgi:predicted O-methyltransferase YrrM